MNKNETLSLQRLLLNHKQLGGCSVCFSAIINNDKIATFRWRGLALLVQFFLSYGHCRAPLMKLSQRFPIIR
jgi:hypothetical protein